MTLRWLSGQNIAVQVYSSNLQPHQPGNNVVLNLRSAGIDCRRNAVTQIPFYLVFFDITVTTMYLDSIKTCLLQALTDEKLTY